MDYVTVVTVDEKLNTIDCNNFDGSTFKKNKIIKIADEDISQFVTVVSVGNSTTNNNNNNSFSVNNNNNSVSNNKNSKSDSDKVELVTVYRLPGERIGLGLKFQGGAKSKENIERLFIQSCAVDSPASRVKTAWGYLNEGDEILQIDGIPVYKLTRLECVKCLKESNVAINFLVKNTKFKLSELNENGVKAPPTPPPIPPRKLHTKKRVESNYTGSSENLVQSNNNINTTTTKSSNSSMSGGGGGGGDSSPTTESNIDFGETESDDTGSTISTVIDKFSTYQSFAECDELSNHKDTESKLDKILNTFTMLEKEFAGSDKPLVQDASQLNDLNKSSATMPNGPPPPIKSRTIIEEKENINPRMETKIVNNRIHPKEPPIPPPRNIIKVEQAKIVNGMEAEKLPAPNIGMDKSAQQFTTIHNWLQDTSDVIHECAIFIDENDNEFNSELYNKQLNGENSVNVGTAQGVESDTESCEKSENAKNLPPTNGGSTNSNSSDDDNDDNLGPFDKMDYSGASEAYFNAHWGPTLLPTIGEVDEEYPSLEPQIGTVTEIIIDDMDDKENQMNNSNNKNSNNNNNKSNDNDENVINNSANNNSYNQNKINLFKNEINEIKINYENINPNCDKLLNSCSGSDVIINNNNNSNLNNDEKKIEKINEKIQPEINNQLTYNDDDHDADRVVDTDTRDDEVEYAVDDVVDSGGGGGDRKPENVLNKNENSDDELNKFMDNSDSENSNHMDHQNHNNIIKCNSDNEKILSISPPTFSRMPPDGDEFPPNFNETILNGSNSNRDHGDAMSSTYKIIDDEMPQLPPPPLPKSSQPIVLTSKTGGTKTYQMYRQDFVIQIDDVRNSTMANSKNSIPIIIEDKVIRKKENLIKMSSSPVIMSPNNDSVSNSNNHNHKSNNNNNNNNKVNSNSNSSNHNNNNNTNLADSVIDMPLKSSKTNSLNSPVVSKDWANNIINNKINNNHKCDSNATTHGSSKPPIQLRNWREDEKSIKSVRDKIAMFSTNSPNAADFSNGIGKFLNRRASITTKSAENLTVLISNASQSTSSTPLSASMNGSLGLKSNSFTKNRAMSVENLNEKFNYNNSSPLVAMTMTAPPPVPTTATPSPTVNYNNRSKSVTNSLPRNSTITSAPRHSILTRAISFNDSTGSMHGLDNDTERKHKINSILEQRKKSISKLRGLVIPEKKAIDSDEILKPVLLDLPEIKNIEIEKIKSINKSITSNGKENHNNHNSNSWIRETKKDSTKLSNSNSQSPVMGAGGNVTTNSLEYKRIFNTNRPTLHSFVSKQPTQPPIKPPRTSLIINTRSFEKLNISKLDYESGDLSDSVSQFSSQKSSPPLSPQSKYPLTRTLSSETNTSIASSTSTLTSGSGSQASCSSLGSSIQTVDMSRRIQKSSNNETLNNRKNILALARCRSGRSDNKNSDGDSTDGYEEIDYTVTKQKPTKNKVVTTSNSGGVTGGDKSIVDKIIKVASYVEIVSDSEVDSEPENIVNIIPIEAKSIAAMNTASIMATPPPPAPVTAAPYKMTKDYQKQKISPAEIRRAFEEKNKAHQQATKSAEMKRYSPKPKVEEIRAVQPPPPPPVRQSSLNENSRKLESLPISNNSVVSSVIKTTTIVPTKTMSAPSTPVRETMTASRYSDAKFESEEIRTIVSEAEPALETPDYLVIELKRETPESSIGITLAGGSDYEAKEITIHRMLKDSPAIKDGRLKQGDRILAINGIAMKGVTHGESISILKTPRSEVILVITRSKSIVSKPLAKSKRPSLGSLSSINDTSSTTSASSTPSKDIPTTPTTVPAPSTTPNKIEKITKTTTTTQNATVENATASGARVTPAARDSIKSKSTTQKTEKNVTINKDGCGLGFSIEGGYDSPNGNIPLLVKKVFMGGAAEKSGQISVGDEITAINDLSTLNLTRVDVWNLMKKLSQGPVKLTLR